ncbi:MAG TPA: LexA family transcriptional regulator [Thermoanaerobaculia bacterium]|jgi:SOS-response transcriptional repressor LexA/DNA-binding Xre family transcriptional regulator
MDIASRLRELLDQRNLPQARLAELAGLPEETVGRIVNGVTKNPRIQTLMKLAVALDVSVGWLLGEKGFEISPKNRTQMRQFIGLLEGFLSATEPANRDLQPSNVTAVTLGPARVVRRGRVMPVAATDWRESFGDRREEEEVDIPQQFAEAGATLIFRAEGDSMTGAHILDRDLLYVREEADPRHARGHIVVCVVNGSPYVKRLEAGDGKIRLVSANDGFAPMVFDEETIEWMLVGVVVGCSHDLR